MIDANGDHDDDKEVEIDKEWLDDWCSYRACKEATAWWYDIPSSDLYLYFHTSGPIRTWSVSRSSDDEMICYVETRGELRTLLQMLGIPSDIEGRQVITSGDWANAWDTARESILNNRHQLAEMEVDSDIINAVLGIIDDNDPRPITAGSN